MLPETLLCLLSATLALAQSKQQLNLNQISSFTPSNIPNPPIFSLPLSGQLSISVALCSTSTSVPRFFVTNSSEVQVPGSSGGKDVYEIQLANGYGSFTGVFNLAGTLAIENLGQTSIEIGVSDNGPFHEQLPNTPLLGDTTSNQVLLFSPPFAPAPVVSPTYPNYTLPAANASLPTPPTAPNFTFIISPTSSTNSLSALPQTACALRSQTSTGTVANQSLWLRDENGWRNQWIIEGLTPQTNYTTYVIQDNSKVSGPIYFLTKSATFACTLVSFLPYCPGVNYAIPLPQPQSPSPAFFDASSIPSSISTPIVQYLTNFTTTLTTFACGRDEYSPIQTCADCQREYRKWLCAISFMRCSEARPDSATTTSAAVAAPTGTAQAPFSAIIPQPPSMPCRNPNFPAMTQGYMMLLPCIETCTAVDRACPNFLGFRCPSSRFGASGSYGIGFVDSADDDGEGQGITGVTQDQWGNVWCNSG